MFFLSYLKTWCFFLVLGFFLDINLFKVNKERATELAKDNNALLKNINGSCDSGTLASDDLANEDENLMIKLKFLTYKVWFVLTL